MFNKLTGAVSGATSYVAGKIPSADKACLVLGLQTIVGVSGAVINVFKCLNDAVRFCGKRTQLFITNFSLNKCKKEIQISKIVEVKANDSGNTNTLRVAQNTTTALKKDKENLIATHNLQSKKVDELRANFVQHAKFVGLDVVRAIPVIGTYVSVKRLQIDAVRI